MISKKARLKQLTSERKAGLKLLNSMVRALKNQLKSTGHPFIEETLVESVAVKVRSLVELSEVLTGGLPEKIEDEHIVNLLGSQEGEKTARSILTLRNEVNRLIESWHDSNRAQIATLEMAEATEEVLARRSMTYLFTGISRQAEAVIDTNWSIIELHYLQFWVWDDVFDYSGSSEKDGGSENE